MPRVVASIEARMSSSRLPGKVLADIGGAPALGRLLSRLRRCRSLDGVVLATSQAPDDDPLAAWARREGLPCHRGSLDDVLDRVVAAHAGMGTDIVVEITGDCPLLDPEVVDLGVRTFLANRESADVVSNTAKPSWPMGVDVQVFALELLREVARTVADPAVREHVSLYFYEHPERHRIFHLQAPAREQAPDRRFQLDYPEDLAFIRAVYARLEPQFGPVFSTSEVLDLLRREPDLSLINAQCLEKAPR